MQTCHSLTILLVVLFQSVRCNQNAAFDKNYSDRLTENNNQQSSQRLNNNAYHASDSNRFIASATDSSQAPHETSHVNYLQWNEKFIHSIFFCVLQ